MLKKQKNEGKYKRVPSGRATSHKSLDHKHTACALVAHAPPPGSGSGGERRPPARVASGGPHAARRRFFKHETDAVALLALNKARETHVLYARKRVASDAPRCQCIRP